MKVYKIFDKLEDATAECRLLNNYNPARRDRQSRKDFTIRKNKGKYEILDNRPERRKVKLNTLTRDYCYPILEQIIEFRKNGTSWDIIAEKLGRNERTLQHYYHRWKNGDFEDFPIKYDVKIHKRECLSYDPNYQKEYQKKHGKKYREKYKAMKLRCE